jgi:capsular exopolysaccharide synthesis family protein
MSPLRPDMPGSEQPAPLALAVDSRTPAPVPVAPPLDPYRHGTVSRKHFYEYLKVVYKRRWITMTAFVICGTFVTINALTTIPRYDATAQILIDKESTNVVSFKQAVEQNQTTDDYYQTQYRMLQSRALARRTIEHGKLWNHPALNPKPDESFTVRNAIGAAIAPVTSRLKGAPATADSGPSIASETMIQSGIIDRFLAGLTVTPIRTSRLVNVKFRSTDPQFAAEAANAHARAFIEQNLEYKFLSSKEASDWLGARLAEQRKLVDESEQALQRYREQNDAISLDAGQDIVVQKLGDLNAAVTRAKTDRIEKEGLFQQIQSIQAKQASLDTFPAILANSFIQQQKVELAGLQRQLAEASEKFGEKHPEIVKLRSTIQVAQAKFDGEVAKVVQSIRNQYLAAVRQETSLAEALNQQKTEALAMNRKGIEYSVLEREAASNRQIFESLMQRTKETGISGELRTNNIRIVDPAETPRGASNIVTRSNILIALLGSAGLGIGLAFLFEYLDNRIKDPGEIQRYLRIPFLGLVPALFAKAAKNPLISAGAPPDFAESFRALRTNLLFSSADQGHGRSIVVTSAAPGEGKTVVATNLSIALAQAGTRVLLVDADLRKPRVHTTFEQSQQPGLSNVLVGEAKAADAVRKTRVAGLWVMTAGICPPNPAELLASTRFRELTASLVQHFDWIIIDTPPVMAVTDASVVAHGATGVVFVVGSQSTDRHAARRAVDQLRSARATVIGGVLNRVDLKHHPYYYAQYYRREYAAYYKTAVEIPSRDRATKAS